MDNFTPLSSLAGGAVIGLAATALLALLGRVAGISGIVAGVLAGDREQARWRTAFVVGLLVGGALLVKAWPQGFAMALDRSAGSLLLAGLMVGFGTRLGNGCTSGHGVCGLARGSGRSLFATVTFLATGMATAFVVRVVLGGVL